MCLHKIMKIKLNLFNLIITSKKLFNKTFTVIFIQKIAH